METTASGGSAEGGTPSFYLVPENAAAEEVILDKRNADYVTVKDNKYALHLQFPNPDQNKITLGRAGCHITLPDNPRAGIQRQQCYFRYAADTGAVILCDKSQNHTTQVYDQDEDFIVPLSQVMNSVVVTRGFNRNISIGAKRHYRFKLVWDSSADPVKFFLSKYPNQFGPERDTFDAAKVRYLQGEVIGYGGFGIVRKAVHIHDGRAMAVKRFFNLEGRGHVMAIREINNMLKLSANNSKKHDHILPILDVVYDKANYRWIEIFMPLMDGSVKSLIEKRDVLVTDGQIGEEVLLQMSLALKFMARHKLVHRDIKPDNILYKYVMDGTNCYYHYQLADFNLSNEAAAARTRAGTPLFMAPEVYTHEEQSCKMDVWSLFVTIVWIYNAHDFRVFYADDHGVLFSKIMVIAQDPLFAHIQDMAHPDQKKRVSAKELVARLDGTDKRAPRTWEDADIASQMSSMMIGGNDDEDGFSGEHYVPSISNETARNFERTYSSSYASAPLPQGSMDRQPSFPRHVPQAVPGFMDGRSALPEFGVDAATLRRGGSTSNAQTYTPGTMGQDYEFTGRYPKERAPARGQSRLGAEKATGLDDEKEGVKPRGNPL